MPITNNQLREFQALYKKHFEIDLDDKEALAQATHLVQLLSAFSKAHEQSKESKK